ncbi:hypothetical protein RJT34_27022 [Clitoria ternatea]|uniref:Cyclotide n=1 Tax=Clitoria ternatea TaxID=43366 RepID=A0AAN9IG42_CLITE
MPPFEKIRVLFLTHISLSSAMIKTARGGRVIEMRSVLPLHENYRKSSYAEGFVGKDVLAKASYTQDKATLDQNDPDTNTYEGSCFGDKLDRPLFGYYQHD